MVGIEGEVEALQAIDQANHLRMLGGAALTLIGLLLIFVMAVRSKQKPISKLPIFGAIALTLAGVVLVQWQVQV